jgi:hypothetical protein
VVLCGSTRYPAELAAAERDLTLAGCLVFGITPFPGLTAADAARLDEAHRRKIDVADRVVVVNPDGYVGPSTRSEIAYAESQGKPVEYLTPVTDGPPSAAQTTALTPEITWSDLRRGLDQLWGWAKAGKNGGMYAMDVENVDRFTDDVLRLVHGLVFAREAAAEQRGAEAAIAELRAKASAAGQRALRAAAAELRDAARDADTADEAQMFSRCADWLARHAAVTVAPELWTSPVHHTEAFTEQGRDGWGWQCFTCGREDYCAGTLAEAEAAGAEHERSPSPADTDEADL